MNEDPWDDSRTILGERNITTNPLNGGCYYVVANRLCGYGGIESAKIFAEAKDGKCAILRKDACGCSIEEILEVIKIDNLKKIRNSLYRHARRVAISIAEKDENPLIDITSMTRSIPEEAQYYCLSSWGDDHCNYATRKEKLKRRKEKH